MSFFLSIVDRRDWDSSPEFIFNQFLEKNENQAAEI